MRNLVLALIHCLLSLNGYDLPQMSQNETGGLLNLSTLKRQIASSNEENVSITGSEQCGNSSQVINQLYWKAMVQAGTAEYDKTRLLLLEKTKSCNLEAQKLGLDLRQLEEFNNYKVGAQLESSIYGKLSVGRTDITEDFAKYSQWVQNNPGKPERTQEFKKSYSHNLQNETSNCSEIDLRNEMGSVYDQGKSDLCYAYVAAELMSYKLKMPVSPLDIAHLFKKSHKRPIRNLEDLKFGGISDALKIASTKGVCASSLLSHQIDFSDIQKYLIDNLNTSLDSFIQKTCSPRNRKDFSVVTLAGTKFDVMNKIDEVLSSHIPIGVGVSNRGFGESIPMLGMGSGHALIVVGRKLDSNQTCQYLLRNTWGKNCSKTLIENGFKCDPMGNVIMKRSDLIEILVEATYLH